MNCHCAPASQYLVLKCCLHQQRPGKDEMYLKAGWAAEPTVHPTTRSPDQAGVFRRAAHLRWDQAGI